MSLIQDFTSYIWNWFIFTQAVQGIYGCWAIGAWGLFFDDDDGKMMNTCFELYNGSMVEFPVEYSFNWSKYWVTSTQVIRWHYFDRNIKPPSDSWLEDTADPESEYPTIKTTTRWLTCARNINLNPTLIKNRILSSVNSMLPFTFPLHLIRGLDPHFYF